MVYYDFNSNFSDATILTLFGGVLGLATLALRYCYTSSCDISFCFGCLHFERNIPAPIEPPVEETKSQDSNEIISNKKENNIYKV